MCYCQDDHPIILLRRHYYLHVSGMKERAALDHWSVLSSAAVAASAAAAAAMKELENESFNTPGEEFASFHDCMMP